MISIEKKWYGTFILFDFPFMDQQQGIGYTSISLEQEDKNNSEDFESVEYESQSCDIELRR